MQSSFLTLVVSPFIIECTYVYNFVFREGPLKYSPIGSLLPVSQSNRNWQSFLSLILSRLLSTYIHVLPIGLVGLVTVIHGETTKLSLLVTFSSAAMAWPSVIVSAKAVTVTTRTNLQTPANTSLERSRLSPLAREKD